MKNSIVFTFIYLLLFRKMRHFPFLKWIVFILFLIITPLVYSQKINFNQPNVFNYHIKKNPDLSENTAPIIALQSMGTALFMATKKHIYRYDNDHFFKIKFTDTKDIQWDDVELYDMITSSDKLIFSTVKHGIWQLVDGTPKQILSKNIKNHHARFLQLFNDELMYYRPDGHFFVTQLAKNKISIPKQKELRVKQHDTFGIRKILITTGHKLFKWSPDGFLFLQAVDLEDFQKFIALNEDFFVFLVEGKLKLYKDKEEIQFEELDKYNVINLEKYDDRYVIFSTKKGYFVLDCTSKQISKLYEDPNSSLKKKIFVDAKSSIWLIENDKKIRKVEKTPFDFIRPDRIKDFKPRKITLFKSKIFVSGEKNNWVLDVNFNNQKIQGLPQQKVNALTNYKNQLMWVAIKNRLFVSSELQNFYPIALPTDFEKNKRDIQTIFQQDDNTLWIFDGVVMHQFILNNKQSKYIDINQLKWYASHRKYDKVNGIYPTKKVTQYKKSLLKKQDEIISIFSDENDKINLVYNHFILIKYGNYFRKIYEFKGNDVLKKATYLPEKKKTMVWTNKGIKFLKNRKVETFYDFPINEVQPLEIILDVDRSVENRAWGIHQNTVEKFILDTKMHQTWKNQFGILSDDFSKSTSRLEAESISLSFDFRKALLIADKDKIIRISRQTLEKKYNTNQGDIDSTQEVTAAPTVEAFDSLTVYQKYSSWVLYGLMSFSVIFLLYGFKSIWKTKKINTDIVHKQKNIALLNEQEKKRYEILLMHYLSVQLMQLNIDIIMNSANLVQVENNPKKTEDNKNDKNDKKEVYEVIKQLQKWLIEKQKALNQVNQQEEEKPALPSFDFLTFLEKVKKEFYGIFALDMNLWSSATEVEEDSEFLIIGTALESHILLLSIFSVLKKENILSMIEKIVWKEELSHLMLNIHFFEPQFEIHTNQNLISSTYFDIGQNENYQKKYDDEISDINQVNFSELPFLLSKITSLSSHSPFVRASWVDPQKELLIEWDCKS